MQMEIDFKQRYLQANGPSPPNFEQERVEIFERLIVLISTTYRDRWLSTGFNCSSLIQAYKEVYGISSEQLETLMALLINIALKEQGLTTDTKIYLLKLLNTLVEYQIKISDNFHISNRGLLQHLQLLALNGPKGTLRSTDSVIEQLAKFVLIFSKFGEEVIDQALRLAVDFNDIRYLVIFVRSLKTEQAGRTILKELFSDNNLWDRDLFWFYLLGQVIKKFPELDYTPYYQTIMQEVMRVISTLIDCINEQSLKKITGADNFLQVMPVYKSAALILVYLMLPQSQPHHVFIHSCIERVFSIIQSSLDYVNQPDYLQDLLAFAKSFSRFFLMRYRAERGQHLLFNEDALNQLHSAPKEKLFIDENSLQFFNSLWVSIIPKIIFLQDSQECKPSKIIAELVMYNPEFFVQKAFDAIKKVATRDDPTLVSFHGVKITLLFLEEYIGVDQPQHVPQFVQCLSLLLNHIPKLGVTDNVDILELIFRFFQFLKEEQLTHFSVQGLMNDCIDTILANLDSMSIGLDGADGEQAELYLDFANIFLPFLIKLDQDQLKKFQEKFLYHLTKAVPEHSQAYEYIAIALCFIDQTYTFKVFNFIYKELVDESTQPKTKYQKYFLEDVTGQLHVKNQQVLRWYSNILQCIFQYHPSNVVKAWPKIQKIFIFLMRQQEQYYTQLFLDIVYNIMLCICKHHVPFDSFKHNRNFDYKTLKVEWAPLTEEVAQLIDVIVDKYFFGTQKYIQQLFSKQISKGESSALVLNDFQTFEERHQFNDTIRIRKRNLKLVEYLLLPGLLQAENANNRKIIYKVLSLQYTILSALMIRIPFHSAMPDNFGLLGGRYKTFRKDCCVYLEWVLQLLGHFHLLAEELFVKLFNYFWRESHDEVAYTSAINLTTEKITPYFYAQMYKRKQLLRSSYLIVNEVYLSYMIRLQLHLLIQPTAHLNNPRYLQSNIILGLNPNYEPSLHSYFPTYVDVHQHHRELIAICRYHLSTTNKEGYLYKFLHQKNSNKKEQYNTAVKFLLISIKKLVNVFSESDCMKDEFVRNTIFQLVGLYKILPKKGDKSLIYEMIYVLLVFSFDASCLNNYPQYSLSKYWSLKLANSEEAKEYEVATAINGVNVENIVNRIQDEEAKALENIDLNRGLKLTRSCSFEHDKDIQKQLERAVSFLLHKIEESKDSTQKDFGVYLLMVNLYANHLPLSHPLIGQLASLLFKLCQVNTLEILDMAKTGLFHIVNRFNYSLRKQTDSVNVPLKRKFNEFLRFKYLGGDNVDYENIKCQKSQKNFYSSEEITQFSYKKLAQDPSNETYQNQKIVLSIFQNMQGLQLFLKNCSSDPELKNSEQVSEAFVLSQDDFKSISTSAHKLMHFIWDCNPTKTPLFMGIIDRYTSSPLNFYNRLFRKIIRMTHDNTREIFTNIASKFRLSEEEEQVRISIYINCELMLKEPESPLNNEFIKFIGDCSKENFDFVLVGLYGIFTSNFVVAEKNYNILLSSFRTLKGSSRFRHLFLLNTYIIAQGRFARPAALEATQLLLKGIHEGGDEISEAVVSMITECFVQAINLKDINLWVEQSLQQLISSKKIYILNEYVGYNNEEVLIVFLNEIMKKTKQEESSIQSSKLRIYSQIVRKILASITIYRFNDYFYNMLKDLIIFVLERPQSNDDDQADEAVIYQLCDSEYPQNAYEDLVKQLVNLNEKTPYVVKKKLMFLQGLVIHRSFRLNKIEVPPLLSQNEKNITLDFIMTVSSILRLMKDEELTEEVTKLLSVDNKKKHEIYYLIALLIATGVRQFEWRVLILKDLLKSKKDKLVKQAISSWWKGKSPQSEQEFQLSGYVKQFENPYSYFA